MEAVTVSPKFQVVIPKKVRQSLKIQPGQKLQVIEYGKTIVLIPVREVKEARGFLKGMSSEIEREEGDRV